MIAVLCLAAVIGLGAWVVVRTRRLARRVEWMERRVIEGTTIEAILARANGRRHLRTVRSDR